MPALVCRICMHAALLVSIALRECCSSLAVPSILVCCTIHSPGPSRRSSGSASFHSSYRYLLLTVFALTDPYLYGTRTPSRVTRTYKQRPHIANLPASSRPLRASTDVRTSSKSSARSEHPSSTPPRRDSDPHRRKDTRGLRGLNAEPWSLEPGGFHGLPQAGQRICRRGRRWRSSSKEKRAIGCRGEGRGVRRVRRTVARWGEAGHVRGSR